MSFDAFGTVNSIHYRAHSFVTSQPERNSSIFFCFVLSIENYNGHAKSILETNGLIENLPTSLSCTLHTFVGVFNARTQTHTQCRTARGGCVPFSRTITTTKKE